MILAATLADRSNHMLPTRAPGRVFVVDDDISVRESLEMLLLSRGFDVTTFASAEAFLGTPRPVVPCCLVLDMRLPGLDGLGVQGLCSGAEGQRMPIVFITGYLDVPMVVRAMKAGALEVLTKPLAEEPLVAAVEDAIDRSDQALMRAAESRSLHDHYACLTRREREVLALLVRGLLNKQVAAELGISEITVKAHRGRVMRKMQARTFAELVRFAMRL